MQLHKQAYKQSAVWMKSESNLLSNFWMDIVKSLYFTGQRLNRYPVGSVLTVVTCFNWNWVILRNQQGHCVPFALRLSVHHFLCSCVCVHCPQLLLCTVMCCWESCHCTLRTNYSKQSPDTDDTRKGLVSFFTFSTMAFLEAHCTHRRQIIS